MLCLGRFGGGKEEGVVTGVFEERGILVESYGAKLA
jgi:hypothetical protein